MMFSQEPAQPGTPEGPMVVVVEDEPALAAFLEWALQSEGYRAVVARDAGAALERIRAETPASVLMDMHLPATPGATTGFKGEAGLRLLREILAHDRGIPVVAVTADGRAGEAARAAGAVAVLLKPFDIGDLFTILHRHIGNPHA